MSYLLITKNSIFLILFILSVSFLSLTSATAQNAKQDFQNLFREEAEDFKLLNQEFIKDGPDVYFLKSTVKYENNDVEVEVPVYLEYPGKSNLKANGVYYPSNVHDIHYDLDKKNLGDKVEKNNLNEIEAKISELINKEGLIKWQIQHGEILKDLPALSLFPFGLENFSFQDMSIYTDNSSESLSSYVTYSSTEFDASVKVQIDHGLKARINFDACDKSSSFKINGNQFYVDKNTDGKDENLSAVYFKDQIRVEVTIPANANQEEFRIPTSADSKKSKVAVAVEATESNASKKEYEFDDIKPLIETLNMEAIKQFEYPSVKYSFDKVATFKIDADNFRDILKIKDNDFQLEDVTAIDDKMIITYHLLYKPEQAGIKIHLAYGDFKKEVESKYILQNGAYRFSSYFEFDCSHSKYDGSEKKNLLSNKFSFDHKKLTQWEKKNVDFSKVNPLVDLVPNQVGDFELIKCVFDINDLEAGGVYKNKKGDEVNLGLTYGMKAVREYHKFQLKTFNGNEEMGTGQFSIHNFNYYFLEKGNDIMALIMNDNLLIRSFIQNDENELHQSKETLKSFLKELGTNKIFNYEPAQDYKSKVPTKTKDGIEICWDPKCMEEKLANCKTAAFGGKLNFKLSVVYTIEETIDNQCRISMVYDRNPNKDWEGKPLYFTIPKDGDFKKEVIQKVTDCMEGKSDECSGPLMEEIE